MADEIKQPTCKRCEELCEELSVQVSDHIDPSINVPWMRGSPGLPKYVQELEARAERAEKAAEETRELAIMQLAGISTAAVQNTETTVKDRITRGNPYWTVAYEDVCAAIDREMRERTRAERAEAACAEMREVLNWVHMGSVCAAPNSVKTDCPICRVLKSTPCGEGYVRREEVDNAREELFAHAKVAARVEADLKAELDAAKSDNARLREALLVIRNRINGHGWGTCGTYGISNAQLYDTDLTMINEALTKKDESHGH